MTTRRLAGSPPVPRIPNVTTITRSPGLPRGFRFAGAPGDCIDIRPIGPITGAAAAAAVEGGLARPLAGGPLAFTGCELFLAGESGTAICLASLARLAEWAADAGSATADAVDRAVERISRPRPPFAGIARGRPLVMGVVNVTPDSFSDGGDFAGPDAAIAHGEALIAAGADILDIGGESARPGAAPTPAAAEISRVLPVIGGLAGHGVPLSVDTRRAAVMEAALEAGATVVNDVTALTGDPRAPEIVARSGASVVLMHMLGEPGTMQDDPVYAHAPYEILRFLADRVAACERAGIARGRIAVDPGIGFGKTDAHNLMILAEAAIFHGTGCVVAIGASRKSFIGRLAGIADARSRLPGSLAAVALAAAQGAQIFRVHDVAETRQALAVLAPALAGDG